MFATIVKAIILAISAISAIVSLTNRPKSKNDPNIFEEVEYPQFDEGTEIIHVFGDVWTDNWMVIGAGQVWPIEINALDY